MDTDYAGTLPAFFRAIKAAGIEVADITHVIATHYHPDHMGLIGQLQAMGARLLLADVQRECIRFGELIFARQRLRFTPIDENRADVISCAESREYLRSLGIAGEIISTPSHSPDSISLVLDSGQCLVGDLEPLSYLAGYEDNAALKADWERILSFKPARVYYAHANEGIIPS